MLRKTGLFLSLFVFTLLADSALARASRYRAPRGSWIASGGIGLTFSPTLLLITPQLEYRHKSNFFYGPLLQLGVSDAVLFTASGTIRFLVGHHPKIKPSLEAGMGIAAASSVGSSSVGLHIMLGMGFDYVIDRSISIGTVVRLNFAPPLKTFFASWPLVVGRFRV